MATLHITEAEAAANLHHVLEQARAGDDVIIESEDKSTFSLRPTECKDPTLEETIVRLTAAEQERGFPLRPDEDFANDLEQVIALHNQPRNIPAWD